MYYLILGVLLVASLYGNYYLYGKLKTAASSITLLQKTTVPTSGSTG